MLNQHIEALIFAGTNLVTLNEIKSCLNLTFGWDVAETDVLESIESLRTKYEQEDFSFELRESGGGYQFLTKPEYAPLINSFLNQNSRKRLTRTALETLSIIAYKQPVVKSEIESIRGVNCDYTVQKPISSTIFPLTFTKPSLIYSSAFLREATPA